MIIAKEKRTIIERDLYLILSRIDTLAFKHDNTQDTNIRKEKLYSKLEGYNRLLFLFGYHYNVFLKDDGSIDYVFLEKDTI